MVLGEGKSKQGGIVDDVRDMSLDSGKAVKVEEVVICPAKGVFF